jgi:lipoate-protein ligase B
VEPTEETPGGSAARPVLEVQRLGRTRYEDAHRLQKELVERRIADEVGDQLILTEHEPVVTLGRGSQPGDVAGVELPVFEIERGGEATYHGPGQVVAYPIVKLAERRRDLHGYLRALEEVVIRVLGEFDVEGRRRSGLTGVWIGDRKVCSIGVAVRRWVAWHGFALNVHTDLEAFHGFNPCGLEPDVMTRLVDHADLAPGTLLVEVLVVKHFCEVLGFDLPSPPPAPAPRFPDLPILPG